MIRNRRPGPLAVGLAAVVLAGLAACGDGATPPVSPPPPPPPPPPPVAPVQVGTIPNQAIETGESVTLEVSSFFRDPDGGTLTYTVASSAPAVVSVALSGSTLTIVGVGEGTVTVTVTARDPDGLTATQSLQVTVTTPNRAPEAVGTIADLTVHVNETATVDAAAHFTDPDGDALTYAASSSDTSVAAAEVSGPTVAVAALAAGSATITVSATDPAGASATQSFVATVANRAPEAVGTIADLTVHVNETATVDAAAHFTDPDGDALTYAASSSDTSVAAAEVSGPTVAVAALAAGSATITVSATDPAGLTATQTFQATVMAPGPDLTFTNVSPVSATLTPGNSATFTFDVLNQGTIPSSATTIRAVRSPNPTISSRDTEIGSYSFAPLGSDRERAFPLTITVGAGSAAGTIYIGMCVDAVTDESNTRNNCSRGARLTIAAPSTARGQPAVGPSVIRIRASRPPEKQGGER